MRFTDKIAQYIKENELDTRHLTIVLPSERAKKYLAASLFATYDKVIYAPQMVTIDQLVKRLSPYPVVDKTRLVVLLYEQHQILQREQNKAAISFDEYLEWAPILLSDFDELDRYLLDVDQIFKDLRNIKDLEYWHLDEADMTPARKRFLEFWDELPKLYHKLQSKLKEIQKMNAGSAYKHLAKNIDLLFSDQPKQHYIFAGFNAMSKSEMDILRQTFRLGRGHIIIDADKFYLDNPSHEAGMFLRQLQAYLDVKELPFVANNLSSKELAIKVVECPQATGQVKVASNELEKIPVEELKDTMVLLADESLIIPFLKNIPKHVQKTNITLGMPLKSSAVKNWVDILFQIQENLQRFKTAAIYHADLKRLFAHPFILSISSPADLDDMQRIEADMVRKNRLFIDIRKLKFSEHLSAIFQMCANSWQNDWAAAMKKIRSLNKEVFKHLGEKAMFEKALVYHFDQAIIDFENIVNEHWPEMRMRSFKSIFTQHWSNKSIAYHGNPVDGLQVMGLLETRLLDFKRIICLGLNEGSMPPTNPIQSMLPMDLRRYAGLPTPREKQGLFAHHFYRLLHHCEELIVTYSGAKDGSGSAERSRYLMQMELELSRINPNVDYRFEFYAVPIENSIRSDKQAIQKDESVIQRLDEFFARSTSISKLNNFNNCPLDFYYKHILDFGEELAVEEEMEASTLGTIVHAVLEDFYRPFARYTTEMELNPKHRLLTTEDIKLMELQCEAKVQEEFLKQFNGDGSAFSTGRNQLNYRMAKSMVENYLAQQRKSIKDGNQISIIALEQNFKIPMVIQGAERSYKILLNGTIDRVETFNNKIRVVDFKTGNTKEADMVIKKEDPKVEGSLIKHLIKSKHGLQLITYAYMYKHQFGVWPEEAGILSLVKPHKGVMLLNCEGNTLGDLAEMFEKVVGTILDQIYDTETPFVHTSDYMTGAFCEYCQ